LADLDAADLEFHTDVTSADPVAAKGRGNTMTLTEAVLFARKRVRREDRTFASGRLGTGSALSLLQINDGERIDQPTLLPADRLANDHHHEPAPDGRGAVRPLK
jgi:hypothetical protein